MYIQGVHAAIGNRNAAVEPFMSVLLPLHRSPLSYGSAPRPPPLFCFLCSYRGYGQSEGKPNQRGLQLDAQAALDHLLSRDDINGDYIITFGRSLGGAVAVHLAADNQDKVRLWVHRDVVAVIGGGCHQLSFGKMGEGGLGPRLAGWVYRHLWTTCFQPA